MTAEKKTAATILQETIDEEQFYLSATEASSIIGAMEAYAALAVAEATKDCYQDAEADGYVFCGKCGKIKEI